MPLKKKLHAALRRSFSRSSSPSNPPPVPSLSESQTVVRDEPGMRMCFPPLTLILKRRADPSVLPLDANHSDPQLHTLSMAGEVIVAIDD
jgi:hypothetical protein